MTSILTIGVPTLAILIGILLNRNDANRIDARITALENNLRTEIGSVRTELRGEFHTETSSVRAEIAAARKQSHDDIVTLLGLFREQDARLTRLEARS